MRHCIARLVTSMTIILVMCGSALSATYSVTSLADNGGSGELRAAILSANANAGSTITFSLPNGSVSGSIILTSALPTITAATTISVPGGFDINVDGAGKYRPFQVAATSVSISNMTIQHGYSTNGGGAILNDGTLILTNCVLSGNSTSGANSNGGAIQNSSGTLTLSNCMLSGNEAGNAGGCLYNAGTGIATFTDCTISGNKSTHVGGAISNYWSGTIKLIGCTLTGNMAGTNGAVLDNDGSASFSNCTLVANTAHQSGCINNYAGSLTLTNCTTTGTNVSTGHGGGICNETIATLTNCILYGDVGTGGEIYANGGTATVTYSDIQGGYSGAGNIDADPLLGSLCTDGGPTQTMALAIGSPCYSKGTSTGAPTTDQRNYPRPSHPSMGAYDNGWQPSAGSIYILWNGSGQASLWNVTSNEAPPQTDKL